MLELIPTEAAVVTCVADEAAISGFILPEGVSILRTAPDELLLVAPANRVEALVGEAAERLSSADTDAVVLDSTDGWVVWTLEGDDVQTPLSRLSEIRLPASGFAQGDVTHVPVKLIREPGRLHLLVPSVWRDHLRERILERCRSLGVAERSETAPWIETEPEASG